MFHQFKTFLASKSYMLLTVIVLGSVAGIGFSILKLDRDNHLSTIRQNVEQALYSATDQAQLRFFEAILVAKNIESILSISDRINEKEIGRVVEDLRKHNPGVIAVALAPGLTITHSFPQNSNRGLIGLKYWEVPEQLASVATAYRRQSPVVDGPIALVQGGTGFILRYPVFLDNPGLNVERFWGVISIAIKAEGVLDGQNNDFGNSEKYIFDLREVQPSGVPSSTNDDKTPQIIKPVVTNFNMLDSAWQASAYPAGGWPSYSPQSRNLLGFALFSAALLIAGLWAFSRLAVKKETAHALLAEAIDCIDEGFIAFDEKERLIVANQKYLDYHPEIVDAVTPGKTIEELLRLWVERTHSTESDVDAEAWIAERLERFRTPGVSFLQDVGNDLWLKVTEAKTPHGHTVGIWTDVTAEKRAQEAAEGADREKTEFLNNVSHELRTPLTVILGRASFMRHSEKLPQSKSILTALEAEALSTDEVASAVSNYQRFVLDQGAGIADSARHMLRLVEDLLDWTKVSRGQLDLNKSVIQIDEVAQAVVEDLRPTAEAKSLSLTYSSDGMAEALADRVRLTQILYNLISNAIKFTDSGVIHLSMVPEDDHIILSVTDTGRGISEENLERVFQRFQQVDGSMTRQNGGLGLGLAISEQLAKLHDGTLSLESTLGKGSTFRLILPRTDAVIELQKTA